MASKVASKRKHMGYATVASVLGALQCHKEGRLDFPLTAQKLLKVAVPEWNLFILYHALEDLGFIRNGNATEIFNDLAQAYQTNQTEYQTILQAHLSHVYAEVFHRIGDVTHASQKQLVEAFRGFDPPKQHRRMAALFKGLMRELESVSNEEAILDEANDRDTDTQSFVSPLNDVLPAFEEIKPMPESSPKTNGTLHIGTDYTVLEEILTSLEELHQELSRSTNWTEADQEKWEKFLKINHTMLGNALKLLKRAKQ